MSNKNVTYNPKVFDVSNIQDAKNIILTPEAGMKTDERWEKETKYLSLDISEFFKDFNKDKIIIDYGCGIGRLSKELIEKFDCKVLGVDISSSMRELAVNYVDNKKGMVI